MSFVAVSAGIGAIGLGTSVAKSIGQSNQAAAINASNPRPTYQIPEEYKQNLALAKQMAQIGLPQQQYNNQRNAINQNQAGAIAALSNSANPGANLAAVVRAGDNANSGLNAQDAALRVQGQHGVLQANSALGNQELARQQYNSFDKYTENFNRAAALQGAANQNLMGGLNGASQLAGSLYGYKQFGNFGKAQATLPSGTAQQMQIPQNMWGMQGLGTTQPPSSGGEDNGQYNSFLGGYHG